MLVLNVGCGPLDNRIVPRGAAWPDAREISLDLNFDTGPDVVGNILNLPFADKTFDSVLASHIMEHLGRETVGLAFKEIYRVLRLEGEAIFRVPDMEWAANEIREGRLNHHLLGVIYGSKDTGHHVMGFDHILLYTLMDWAGFKIEQRLTGMVHSSLTWEDGYAEKYQFQELIMTGRRKQ